MTRSEKKHIAMIAAAKNEFIERGFLAANMDSICTRAEVSKRTLYRHFESKAVLFQAVLGEIQLTVDDTVDYPFDNALSLYTQLTALTYKEVDILYCTYGLALSKTIIMEFLREPELAKSVISTVYATRGISKWFAEAIQHGKIKQTNATEITEVYNSLFQGFFLWPQLMQHKPIPEGLELEQKISTVVSVVLNAYQQ
ncbi:TetR/AcrR family transcriptional regulator [Thaumasiovibrio sp. DFM-14]|uniref:TetR/AcrR family transcriptional regulator n=1 Tax=Thaumasiovibrio sp. DFM-14 TaxID=3384792 RepID=UPI0039A33CF9